MSAEWPAGRLLGQGSRRLDEKAEILLFERTGFISYANCGLPYYVGGVIKSVEELTLQTPESFWNRFRIKVRVRHEVVSIDTSRKTVMVRGLDTGETFEETYDKLILSPGAKPVQPEISAARSERIFTLRTVEDTLRIRAFLEREKPKTAVLAGGGIYQPGDGGKPNANGRPGNRRPTADQLLSPLESGYGLPCARAVPPKRRRIETGRRG